LRHLSIYGPRPEIQDFSVFSSFARNHPLYSARVIFQSGERVRVSMDGAEVLAVPSGRLLATDGPPVVGDWVLVSRGFADELVVVHGIHPRRGVLVRLAPGRRTESQLIAANVDRVLLLAPADPDWNPRRVERAVAWAAGCGIPPIVVLTKIDGNIEWRRIAEDARRSSPGIPVVPISARSGEGLDELLLHLHNLETVALVGASGAGKSTLVNRLSGFEVERTGGVRESDGKGCHTTTHRRLIRLPSGALLVDTPGYRELGLWESGEGISAAFPEIEEAARACRFRDCRHAEEPGCAVRAAVDDGSIDAGRLLGRHKLEREALALERRRNVFAAQEDKRRVRRMEREIRRRRKGR